MGIKKAKGDKLKLKIYADLANTDGWKKTIKPDLENIKREYSEREVGDTTIDEAAIRDIKRSQTIKIINKIIRKVEKASSKL